MDDEVSIINYGLSKHNFFTAFDISNWLNHKLAWSNNSKERQAFELVYVQLVTKMCEIANAERVRNYGI